MKSKKTSTNSSLWPAAATPATEQEAPISPKTVNCQGLCWSGDVRQVALRTVGFPWFPHFPGQNGPVTRKRASAMFCSKACTASPEGNIQVVIELVLSISAATVCTWTPETTGKFLAHENQRIKGPKTSRGNSLCLQVSGRPHRATPSTPQASSRECSLARTRSESRQSCPSYEIAGRV